MKSSLMSRFMISFSLCCGLLWVSPSVAQELLPFDEWLATRAKWKDDPSEVSYVGARCSSLFAIVGGYFLENPSKAEDLETGKSLSVRGRPFSLVSTLIGISSGMSQEALMGRTSLLQEIYAKKLVQNKRLHNNIFQGSILSDLRFCIGVEPIFGVLVQKMPN